MIVSDFIANKFLECGMLGRQTAEEIRDREVAERALRERGQAIRAIIHPWRPVNGAAHPVCVRGAHA
jgi:hypothetical protein